MRAVLDANILIAALLSPRGAPARIVSHWTAGAFELIVSNLLLEELERALGYSKLRAQIPPDDAAAFVSLLRDAAVVAADPATGSHHSSDAGDDYWLALAGAERALLVTGDGDLLALGDELPIVTARAFLDTLDA